VGIIGCGQAATISHLPALQHVPEVEVVALADVDADRLREVADRFQIQRRHESLATLLADPTIEAVGVCVPAERHLEVASAVLEAGKHLFLEKPIAVSLEDADRLIERAAHPPRRSCSDSTCAGTDSRRRRAG
jgi:predicted dehydrogenase